MKKIINQYDYQGTSVINYPEKKFKYTRIHEPKHLHPERKIKKKNTLIIKEYSLIDPKKYYYPVNNNINKEILLKYKKEQKKQKNYFWWKTG